MTDHRLGAPKALLVVCVLASIAGNYLGAQVVNIDRPVFAGGGNALYRAVSPESLAFLIPNSLQVNNSVRFAVNGDSVAAHFVVSVDRNQLGATQRYVTEHVDPALRIEIIKAADAKVAPNSGTDIPEPSVTDLRALGDPSNLGGDVPYALTVKTVHSRVGLVNCFRRWRARATLRSLFCSRIKLHIGTLDYGFSRVLAGQASVGTTHVPIFTGGGKQCNH